MSLMRFTKGALTYRDLQEMPISEIFDMNEVASKVSKREDREAKRSMK